MQSVPQDLLKEYVQSQHFTSTTEIMAAMKEMFRDVIQTVMEVEMDEELGRERCERSGIVKKTAHPTNSLRQPAPDFAPTVRACAAEEGFPHWLYCVGGGYSRSRSIGRSFAEPAPAA